MARSDPCISATFASTSLSSSALPLRPLRRSAFSSLARSLIAARSSSVNPLDFSPCCSWRPLRALLAAFSSHCNTPVRRTIPSVLHQPEDVAIEVGDGGHQAAATDVVRGLLHGGAGGGHLGQLRLDVRHVPVGHR